MTKAQGGGNRPPTPEGLAQAAGAATRRGAAPVHLWDPPYCGEIDLRITRDGAWLHEGRPILRPEMVRLFASILKREEERYFLVTPVEKVGITVDDVPFVAVDFAASGAGRRQVLSFVTSLGDEVEAGPGNLLRLGHQPGGAQVPYLMLRAGLEARLDRKSYYRLVEMATSEEIEGRRWLGLWSNGLFFRLAPEGDRAG